MRKVVAVKRFYLDPFYYYAELLLLQVCICMLTSEGLSAGHSGHAPTHQASILIYLLQEFKVECYIVHTEYLHAAVLWILRCM